LLTADPAVSAAMEWIRPIFTARCLSNYRRDATLSGSDRCPGLPIGTKLRAICPSEERKSSLSGSGRTGQALRYPRGIEQELEARRWWA